MWRRHRRRQVIHEAALLCWKKIADGALMAGGCGDDVDKRAACWSLQVKWSINLPAKTPSPFPPDNKPLFGFFPLARSPAQSAREILNSLLLASRNVICNADGLSVGLPPSQAICWSAEGGGFGSEPTEAQSCELHRSRWPAAAGPSSFRPPSVLAELLPRPFNTGLT